MFDVVCGLCSCAVWCLLLHAALCWLLELASTIVARARRKTRHARRLPEKAKVDVAALEQNMRNQKNDVGTGLNIRGIDTLE